MGFSYKKTRLIPSGCNEQDQLEWIESFKELEKNITDNEAIMFGDGTVRRCSTP